MTTEDVTRLIREQIAANPILLYMKGTPEMPRCGFSARAVQAIQSCGVPFETVDVLAFPEIRATLPIIAEWPTFPQLWVKGELIGGCDIVCEMLNSGELAPLLKGAVVHA
jgi:monothiol glutaredoxin